MELKAESVRGAFPFMVVARAIQTIADCGSFKTGGGIPQLCACFVCPSKVTSEHLGCALSYLDIFREVSDCRARATRLALDHSVLERDTMAGTSRSSAPVPGRHEPPDSQRCYRSDMERQDQNHCQQRTPPKKRRGSRQLKSLGRNASLGVLPSDDYVF